MCKSIEKQFGSNDFVKWRLEYWGFLLAFSAFIVGPEQFKNDSFYRFFALLPLTGLMITMIHLLVLIVLDNKLDSRTLNLNQKLRKPLGYFTFLIDIVFYGTLARLVLPF